MTQREELESDADVLEKALQRLKGSKSVPAKDAKLRRENLVPPEQFRLFRSALPSPSEAEEESSSVTSPRLDRSASDVRFYKSTSTSQVTPQYSSCHHTRWLNFRNMTFTYFRFQHNSVYKRLGGLV